MERQLQRLTWSTIKQLVPGQIETALFPIGTVEAHGATPVGTDNIIPETIAGLVAERTNALIAPTLNYGITRSLYRYPGSIRIQPPHFTPFVADILESLADSSFKYVIILNGHGGNNACLKEAAYEVHCRRRIFIAVVHWWLLVRDLTVAHFGQVGGHGGIDETACIQAIDPKLVRPDEYTDKTACLITDGADVFPSPGTVLIYKEGEGYPNFDLAQAQGYLPKVADVVGDFIVNTIDRWRTLEA